MKIAQGSVKSIPVHLLAFKDKGTIRNVNIPLIELTNDILSNLELVFRYGQNDFQPQNFPSVSVGDIVDWDGQYYEVKSMGFKPVSKGDFENMRGNRSHEAHMQDWKEQKSEVPAKPEVKAKTYRIKNIVISKKK